MKVLIIGGGGREHALAWKIAQNDKVDKIFVAPGNAGTALMKKGQNIKLSKVEDLLRFALLQSVDLTIVGSENLLVKGIVDKFTKYGLKIFGPDSDAALLEGSKAFAKDFMSKYGVKTAQYQVFEYAAPAKVYLETATYPVVVKASGLAAGKGVLICHTKEEAFDAVNSIMRQRIFGNAGNEVVIEEYLEGVEASILSVTDGNIIVPFISAKDHKKIGEGETGPNTGGMGVVAPNPHMTKEVFDAFRRDILEPTLNGLKAENLGFHGFIFFGLMITKEGPYLLEYNVRLGDPETQAILPLLKNDLTDALLETLDNKLDKIKWEWDDAHSCCVVAASKGYPGEYEKGKEITGLEKTKELVFLAGVEKKNGRLLTSGGRVLNVVGTGSSLAQARKKAYDDLKNISFEGMTYRKDIGKE